MIISEIVGEKSYGFKADSWSFGCILYAMFTGFPPFEVSLFICLWYG